jgi:broad specificity phosphatase PhoE
MQRAMNNQKARFSKPTVIIGVLLTLLGTSAFSPDVSAQNQSKTVILVRHAEKMIVPESNTDPDLSDDGFKRAQELARMFSGSGLSAIYITQFKRTFQTVKALSARSGVTTTRIETSRTADLISQIRARGDGQVIFVAGHDNTVPQIIEGLGGPHLDVIPRLEFDNLFILTVHPDGSARLLKIKYGKVTPPPTP